MHDQARQKFLPFSIPLEGCVPWMYLDILGLVTVAVGVLIDPIEYALSLPFAHPDGTLATREEVAAAWHNVKSKQHLALQGYRVAARHTTIRLTDDGVQSVVARRLDKMEAVLAARFPQWDSWPWQAQLGVLSVAWACGPGFRFPKFEAALHACDWGTAAVECKIREAGNPGIKPRNVENRKLFEAAAASGKSDAIA